MGEQLVQGPYAVALVRFEPATFLFQGTDHILHHRVPQSVSMPPIIGWLPIQYAGNGLHVSDPRPFYRTRSQSAVVLRTINVPAIHSVLGICRVSHYSV